MHYEGHAHGWVHPAAITLSSGKAVLQNSTTTRQATARGDIQAFGALLHEMLQGRKPANEVPIPVVPRGVPRSGYEGLKAAAGKLAARCLSDDSVTMQYVVTEVRLLKVLSRYNPPPGRAEDPPQVSSDCEPVESERLALKRCPNCGSSFVYESKARTAIERLLDSTGVPLRRCRRCYHRYVTVLGVHFTKAGPSE